MSDDEIKAVTQEIKDLLKANFKSKVEAFDKLGGKNDGVIDRAELAYFMGKEIGYKGDVEKVFDLIDIDHDGQITRKEFLAFGNLEKIQRESSKEEPPKNSWVRKNSIAKEDTVMMDGLKALLKKNFKSKKEAFDKLGGKDDGKIDPAELSGFLTKDLSWEGNTEKAFQLIDMDGDGQITKDEFLQFFKEEYKETTTSSTNAEASNGAMSKGDLTAFKEFLKNNFKGAKDAFQSLDVDNDKNLQLDEFKSILKEKFQFTGDADVVFKALDEDGDGMVSFKEFKHQLGPPEKEGEGSKGSKEPPAARPVRRKSTMEAKQAKSKEEEAAKEAGSQSQPVRKMSGKSRTKELK